ncbi:MAG TPA: zf-HC2 domain-containing protein [Gemmatimonadales bacterium]|nr:zf-HC2 domain-containing protein [Gemmatimonadales bacterium]
MSHVDEGTLHAYFDGELPPSERSDLEAHIAQCAACSARLGEERALFERARALLGVTRPADRPAPPFERVRRAPARPWYVRTSVAWAASLVLALGLGYVIRGSSARLGAPVGSDQLVAGPETETVAQAPQPSPGERDQYTPARPATSERERTARRQAAQAQELAHTDSFLGFSAPQPPVQLRGAKPAAAAADARALDSMLGRRDAGAAAVAALEEAPVTTPPPARGAERRAAATPEPSANRNDPRSVRVLSTTWPLITRGKAASLLGDEPVGVPGLATRGIRQRGDSTVVVEQALDSHTVIQITQRPANAPETAERERADRVLARYVGRLRVEISGPVSTDSLNKLLEQVAPIP